jgi:hypothetical protein
VSVVVFTGPTLAPADAESLSEHVTALGPASMGSVYRAVRDLRPTAVVLVDGLYETVPAVWHRELLQAMAQGVHVVGGASMGALRAAELAPFGMFPAGDIARQYLAGELTDDDEVAVVHAPARSGYRKLSEALVNIRATLDRAVAASALSTGDRESLVALAKRAFYPDRSYAALVSAGGAAGTRLGEYLRRAEPVDQKRVDAVEAVRWAIALHAAGQPHRPNFAWEHTSSWRLLTTVEDSEWVDDE